MPLPWCCWYQNRDNFHSWHHKKPHHQLDPKVAAVARSALSAGARDRGVALARIASEHPRRRPVVPPVPEVETSGEIGVRPARVAAPSGSPPGGFVLIGAGMIGLASFLIRRRFRPTYT